MHEFDHPIPEMETIDDVLAYIRGRAKVLTKGEWIVVQSGVHHPAASEQRYPTKDELDEAAPDNPVVFATGPDASLNTPGAEAEQDRQGFQGDRRRHRLRGEGPDHRRADRHPAQLHALRQEPVQRPAADARTTAASGC